jgi:hypothetical protein
MLTLSIGFASFICRYELYECVYCTVLLADFQECESATVIVEDSTTIDVAESTDQDDDTNVIVIFFVILWLLLEFTFEFLYLLLF